MDDRRVPDDGMADNAALLSERLDDARRQLLQAEKLASLGQLAAGVAHEINNPVGYINSNLQSLRGYFADMCHVLDAYRAAEANLDAETREELEALRRSVDLDFLVEDVAALLDESREGLARVLKIIQAMKDFSRREDPDWQEADLHQGLESTLNIVHNEIKYKAEVRKEYGDLPLVECLLPNLNQVFMNLLVNAAQAIEARGVITIRTGREGVDHVWIEIADTGPGISPEHLAQLFDPFFTTKPAGKGTGLGLPLSRGIVEEHGGSLEVSSSPGSGTCFRIRLPVHPPAAASGTERAAS